MPVVAAPSACPAPQPLVSLNVVLRPRSLPPCVQLRTRGLLRGVFSVRAVFVRTRRAPPVTLPRLRTARAFAPTWALSSRTLRCSRFGRPVQLLKRALPWAARNVRAPDLRALIIHNDDAAFNNRHAKRSLIYLPEPNYHD
mgnify:CR=1 FL=1